MASSDEVYITFKGEGGHGAMPHLTRDPIAITATLLTALQQIISRNANPISPSVLTFGKIWSDGGATNVIPARVHVEGTFRALDEAWRAEAHDLLTNVCEGIAKSMGASSSWASRNMLVLGALVLVFLVMHIIDFFWVIKFCFA